MHDEQSMHNRCIFWLKLHGLTAQNQKKQTIGKISILPSFSLV
jgi:hypothetical protein